MYESTKKYGHDVGLSCCFRQWRATHSHCSLMHGYALAFEFTFSATEKDERNWVVDFGDLDELKASLKKQFDHTTLVAQDDPKLDAFQALADQGLIDLRIVEATGCEATAELAYRLADELLTQKGLKPRVHLEKVQVWEHGANSASFVKSRHVKVLGGIVVPTKDLG